MSDSEGIQESKEQQVKEEEIEKEIKKLNYYIESASESLALQDVSEIQVSEKQATKVINKLTDLISKLEEFKIDQGISGRAVRQWKKEIKAKYANLITEKEKLTKFLEQKEMEKTEEKNRKQTELKEFQEECAMRLKQQKEKEIWEERLRAELATTKQKLEMEKAAKQSIAKLPKLNITSFQGTPADWVRFENMFISQVDAKPIADEEKFGYLLEMVHPKVRNKISNLKPGTLGYKTAWERLKREYGQTKLVVNAHMDEIINLAVIKGGNYERVQEFYDKLSKNFDALETLGESDMLKGFMMTTLNKLPHIKPDIVRLDDEWEFWGMRELIENLQKWLRRNKHIEQNVSPGGGDEKRKREKHWFTQKGENERQVKRTPKCLFCEKDHWGENCPTVNNIPARRQHFVDNKLCFNCARGGHRGAQCRSRGCFHCKQRHHSSICPNQSENKQDNKQEHGNGRGAGPVMTGYSPQTQKDNKSLPPIVPVKVQGIIFWAYLDTGSGRNFIASDAIKRLNLSPKHHEFREILTVTGSKKQSMPIFNITIESFDGSAKEEIEVTGTNLPDFTTISRPDMNELKHKYEHTKDKRFYMMVGEEYPLHLIVGDKTYSRIRTEEVYKGKPGEPIVEGTTFGWVIHGGDFDDTSCMFVGERNDYEKLYSLDVLGVEDRGEDDPLDVYREFKESVRCDKTGRYEVSVPWIPGRIPTSTNEEMSRKRLASVERKLKQNPELQKEYSIIIEEQLENEIVERVPEESSGKRVFYMPHKPVIRQEATTTKVRMVFDASSKSHPLATSINDCMYTGPPLQPLLWDIMIRARMSKNLLLADLRRAYLQIGIREEERDAFRFLFNINNKEESLRFRRVPFGVEASPFLLGATLHYHYDQQPPEFEKTVRALRENTYVDNLMKTGCTQEELITFKQEATSILESAKFPVHKWESNIQCLESDDTQNPSKILGHIWNKREDTLEVIVPKPGEPNEQVTKKTILSKIASIYDPLGIISPMVVQGKHIYRKACDEANGWNTELPNELNKEWIKWINQLENVKVPRSILANTGDVKQIHLHTFADASNMACSAVTIAVVEHENGVKKGLLTSKSRISKRNTSIPRLELVGAHMAANLVKNLSNALTEWPFTSATVWLDSTTVLYWILNPEKQWKVFVSNRVKKIAQITSETNINWKYVPTSQNLADLGSRGANIHKLTKGEWFTGSEWLLDEHSWPEQPPLKSGKDTEQEYKAVKEEALHNIEIKPDEWDDLLKKSSYWKVLRVTAWVLRFMNNALANKRKLNKINGPLTAQEISKSRDYWVLREQRGVAENLQGSGWQLSKDESTGILKCKGRIKGYEPTYLNGGLFVDKLIQHTHQQIMHLGVANTMASIRRNWWIPKLRSKVKRIINQCNTCKVFQVKPSEHTSTAPMPSFRTRVGKPFETTGVDFAGPLHYRISKKEQGKYSILIFTCATSRAVHLEVTKTQTAEEFQRKLNAFISRRTRPHLIISDNASVFKTTANWLRKIRKNEKLNDYLAKEEIKWQFNLSRSPWWGGMYERLIKDIKKMLYKTMGKTVLNYEQVESVVMDIERHMNNRPLTYVESDAGDYEVLTPNVVMWGENINTLELEETEEDELTKMVKRLRETRRRALQRWQNEYLHSLMEYHRVNRNTTAPPDIGEIVLVVGNEKNRAQWKKGKVVQHIKGKDGVVRGVSLLCNGRDIERPLNLVCRLEIKGPVEDKEEAPIVLDTKEIRRSRRQAAQDAQKKIGVLLADDDEDD